MSQTMTTVHAYVSAHLTNMDEIHEIRDDMRKETGAGSTYTDSTAHLTIVPPFTLPAEKVHEVNVFLSELGLDGLEITIRGAGVWPSIRNPRVVLLDCDVDLEEIRHTIISYLVSIGAEILHQPVSPHVTLFKCDNGYLVTDEFRERLQNSIHKNRTEWTTDIKYIDLVLA